MSFFSALRDGYHDRNRNQSRKSRRGRGHSWSSHSRTSRARASSPVELLEARQLLSAIATTRFTNASGAIYVDANSTSTIEAGTQADPYHHIQAAIDHSQAGDTLSIAPGTYVEALVITHPLRLLGPNAGINPNTGSRTAEAVIIPPVNSPGGGVDVLVQADDVTIDGLTIDGHNAALSGGTVLNDIALNAASGISNVDGSGKLTPISGLLVRNDIIRNFTAFGVIGDADLALPPSAGNAIRDNRIDNIPYVASSPIRSNQGRGISIEDGFYADVTGNVLTRCATGIQAIVFLTSSGAAPSTISDNTIQEYDRGILLYTLDTGTPTFVVARNAISAASGPYTTATNAGLEIARALGSTTVTAADNTVTGARVGVKLNYDTTPNLTVSGGRLSGNGVGVLLTNADPANSVPEAVRGDLAGVVVQDCSAAGLEVDDVLAPGGATATLSVDAATAVTGSPHGVILDGPNARLAEAGPPTVSFTTAPPSLSNSSDATFAYTVSNTVSTPNDLVVRYSLDGQDVTPTSNPVTLGQLSDGPHTFAVTVTDQAGESGTATHQWTVQASDVGSVSVAVQSGTLTYGTAGNATFTITVNRDAGNGSFDADLSIISTLPSGASASFLPTSVHFSGSDSSRTATLTISTSATTPAGVTSFTVKAVNHSNATGSATGSGTLTIAKRALHVTATGQDKVYDGTTGATVTLSDDRLSGDALTDSYTTATFADKDVGTGKTVGVVGIGISGGASANYTLANTSTSASTNITARTLHVTAAGQDKVYDGTTGATVTLSDDRLSGDDLTTSYTTATFDTKDVGTGKAVSVSGISIGGGDAGNYSFNATASTTADISKRALVVSAAGQNKVYGSANPVLTGTVTGLVDGDQVTPTFSTDATQSSGVGDYAVVPSLADPNYNVTCVNGKLTVTPAPLTVIASPATKFYGQANPTLTGTILGLVPGDTVTATYSTTATQSSVPGTYPITATLSDPNYTVTHIVTGILTVRAEATSDFNGDGKSDVGLFRVPTAQWLVAGQSQFSYGDTGLRDIPVPADYLGQGHSQVAVFRPSTAQWIVNGQVVATFGATNLYDIPVPADYDGVGHAEFAVYRPSTAQWLIAGPRGLEVYQFGWSGLNDIPVPADYLGLGHAELAVYRPSTAQWFIAGAPQVYQFGWNNLNDIPVPGDYLGVGHAQIAVFRPSTAQWFIAGGPAPSSYGAVNLYDMPLTAPIGALRALAGQARYQRVVVTDIPPTASYPILEPVISKRRKADEPVWLAALEALTD